MRTFKRITGFVTVNVLILALMTCMLSQPSALKILIKEAKNVGYNAIIIGQSHGETSYNPFVLSAVTDNQFFNLSRRGMPVVNLSYILEEANTDRHYSHVILDLDPSYWVTDHRGTFGTDTNLLFRLTGTRWLAYLKNVLAKDNYNDTIADYNFCIDNIKKIPKNIEGKFSREYIEGEEAFMENTYASVVLGTTDRYKYLGRGFRYGLKKSGVEWPRFNFISDNVKEENLRAFRKIVEYCNDNDIELICVQSALPPYRLQNENMDEVHEYFTVLCSEYGVPFYDLNYLKEEYLSRTDDDYVDLDGHMMGELADRQSAVLGQILISENREAFFYDNYDDVLSHLN